MPKLVPSDEELTVNREIKRASERLLNKLQYYHGEHDVPGIDDFQPVKKENTNECN